MKVSIVISTLAVLAAKVSANCFSINLGYPCCQGNKVEYVDSDGEWGYENNNWCGIAKNGNSANDCFSIRLGYPCCQGNKVEYIDDDGEWGIENNNWCGIVKNNNNNSNTTQNQGSQSYPYPLKNAPVQSKGCGKDPNLPKSNSFDYKWSQGVRTIRIDVPENYDNNKPYCLIFGMHCLGGWGGGVQQEGYYGLKPLDTDKTTIFVAPEGILGALPWSQAEYTMFDELLETLKEEFCIDESRVFSTGFSYGSMFTNGLSWNHQKVLRAVAVYEVAERDIWLPEHTGDGIGWMAVLGFEDGVCTAEMARNARDIILSHNSEGGKALQEIPEEAERGGPHKCYDYKLVDEKFPVRWCTQSGGHIWDHKDPGQSQSWVPQATWDFFSQF